MSRESFLEKLTLLIVSYFCISTEMRFMVQSQNMASSLIEQEYYHVRALDISVAFLPNECPLLNHIILSYQKHHDSSNVSLSNSDEVVKIKALNGIENSKF
jgi:flagellar motor switch protein FliG